MYADRQRVLQRVALILSEVSPIPASHITLTSELAKDLLITDQSFDRLVRMLEYTYGIIHIPKVAHERWLKVSDIVVYLMKNM